MVRQMSDKEILRGQIMEQFGTISFTKIVQEIDVLAYELHNFVSYATEEGARSLLIFLKFNMRIESVHFDKDLKITYSLPMYR